MRRLQLAFVPIVALGCVHSADENDAGGSTSGFSYAQGCFFGCPLERPLLVGSHQSISVSGADDAAGIEVDSSDATIAEFAIERDCYCERKDDQAHVEIAEDAGCSEVARKHCDNSVLVHAKAAGDARLELRKNGKLVDRASVLVREARSARVRATFPDKLGAQTVDSLSVKTGDEVQLDVDLYDKDGLKLLASDGVSFGVDDESIATVTAWLVGSGKQVNAGTSVTLDAKAAGQTRLTIAVPGLERELDVNVAAN